MSCKIIGIGGYLPGTPIPNHLLPKDLNTSDEWISSRTGISQRYFADESVVEMAYKSAVSALESVQIESGSIDARSIDLIIVSSCTSDRAFPSIATRVQNLLKIPNIPAFDINSACSGFAYGASVAKAMIESRSAKRVLFICAEKMSSLLSMKDRSVDVLFGDGAASTIIEKSNDNCFDVQIGSDPEYSNILFTERSNGVETITMQGKDVYKYVVNKMITLATELLKKHNITKDDVDFFVMHQANLRIIESVASNLGLDIDKVSQTVSIHANTSAASVPLALHDLSQKVDLKGKLIMIIVAGAGMTYGAALVRM